MSMDIQENPTKVPLSENAILHQSGVSFFRIFTAYRKEKKIRTEKIVSGVISRRAFLDIEKGKSVLSRENWKFLMHRIGIVTDYFETVVSRKELKDWRCREDICLSVCEAEKEYYEALSYTFELSWLSLEELPFIRSEEGIIISNIADIYHDMGNLKKSEELFEKLSLVYQKKQMFLKINSSASAIILGQYSRLLGDIMNYKKALYIDSVNLQYELNDFNLIHIENLLYNQAWAYYEIDREQNNKKIQRKFWVAQRFAEFNRKEELINLLKMRENKYMKDD